MIRIEDDKPALYQWDLNRRVELLNVKSGAEVHFADSYTANDDCLVVFSYEENGKVFANIPNVLLQRSGIITAYVYVHKKNQAYTEYHIEILVLSRSKPSDYVYTETEVLNYSYLDKRIKDLEGEGLANAVSTYLKENPVEAGATKEEAAQIVQNTADIEMLTTAKLDADKLPEAIDIALAQAKASGEFDGADGAQGPQGIQGIPGEKGEKGDTGAPGKTPVKGTDYFTAADKAEMVEDVLEAMDGVPSYWQIALDDGAKSINTALCEAGRNKSAFLFYSDAHWNQNSQMSPKLLKHLYKNTGMTKTFFGGDIVNNEASDYDTMKYICDWRNQIKDLPNHHSVVGNHDDGNATNNLFTEQYVYGYLFAAEETYDMVMGDGLYYYIDNPAEKTRYICLDTAFQTSEEKQTQMLSFLTEALKSTKSGWHIVVVSHIWYLPDYNQYDVKPIPIVGMSTEATAVCNVLDNYNARSGDFTDCGAKVEFCIGGHVHRDYVGTTTGGISIILVETDSQHIRSEFTYTAGTTTESSVNGVVADYNTNKVNIVRVGRGNSFVVDLSSGGTSDPDEPDTPAYTNLFVKSEAHDDYRLNSSGILTASSGDLVTGFISVQPNTSYTIRTYNKSNPYKSAIGRLSEYSAANESNHVVQYRVSEHEDHYYEGVTCVFPFTTSATTKFIRLNMAAGKGCDFIITLNEPIE